MQYYNFQTPRSEPVIAVDSVEEMFKKLWHISTTPTNPIDVSGVLNGCRVTIQWCHTQEN